MIRDTIWIVLRSYRAFIVSTGEVGSVMIFIAESKGERSFKIGQFWQRYRQEYMVLFLTHAEHVLRSQYANWPLAYSSLKTGTCQPYLLAYRFLSKKLRISP